MRETKVRLVGWCEGSLGQQRNDDNARKIERVKFKGSGLLVLNYF